MPTRVGAQPIRPIQVVFVSARNRQPKWLEFHDDRGEALFDGSSGTTAVCANSSSLPASRGLHYTREAGKDSRPNPAAKPFLLCGADQRTIFLPFGRASRRHQRRSPGRRCRIVPDSRCAKAYRRWSAAHAVLLHPELVYGPVARGMNGYANSGIPTNWKLSPQRDCAHPF